MQLPWPIFRHTSMSSCHLYKSRIEFILIFIIFIILLLFIIYYFLLFIIYIFIYYYLLQPI